MTGVLGEMSVKEAPMAAAAEAGFATATDLADYLVRNGVAFRDAHDCVGQAVAYAIGHDIKLNQSIGEDVYEVLTLEGSVNARNHFGGTAPAQVRDAVRRGRDRLTAGNPQ